ncbi:MAG: nicotinate phosphoribosyltransferase, partial [Nitrosospira sp.]
LLSSAAPIDGFGVGTALDASSDAPSLDCAYKLQEYAGRPRRKRSEGKATWPGKKQVYRNYNVDGRMSGDVVALEENDSHGGQPLLIPVMQDGRRIHADAPLDQMRQRALAGYAGLPKAMTVLEKVPAYPVVISAGLQALASQLDKEHAF